MDFYKSKTYSTRTYKHLLKKKDKIDTNLKVEGLNM